MIRSLRKVNPDHYVLDCFAERWRQQGADAFPEKPSGEGMWLMIEDEQYHWRGWLNLHDWVAWAIPELAGFAVSDVTEKETFRWFTAESKPVDTGISDLSYQKLLISKNELPTGILAPYCIRVNCPGGPLWINYVTESSVHTNKLYSRWQAYLTWPVDLVLGFTRLEGNLFKRIHTGDVLIIRDVHFIVRTFTKIFAHYRLSYKGDRVEIEESIPSESVAQAQSDARNRYGQEQLVFPSAINPGDLPVSVEFVLRTEFMTLNQLEKFIVLDKFLKLPSNDLEVQMRINGVIVGTGEFVQIEDRIGVEVHQWLGESNAE
ncbi:TPA: FliM/FliN family flagellar motor switch protein [Salmonella enterica]|nr:hypothetical protein [Salmonella enterica subsp. diarizonae]HEA0263510.1 FliM/FliN family flagellar motor switch protein [Salmonella enterica]HEA0268605.1 FliM/FliN family flagellar motor switch protein [Salmonella enterica]HEA0295542.1 FliM/FliN family flagellar motor switch protein [Salmonella enterica]HEA0304651.1 FliM/FliN family flagellar motor switch protein [Salmonella enterica]